jgi:ABC-type nitrate/sulfonate/bicarbonate transport system substrate-binding protein
MQLIRRAVSSIWPTLFFLIPFLLFACPRPVAALEEVIVSYAGPTVTFLPAEVARQRGFLREQNLDIKLLLTRSEVDRAALISGSVDYTLRAGSSFVSAARGLPVRIVFLGTMKPFWGLVVRPEVKSVGELKGKSVGVPGLLGSQQVSAKKQRVGPLQIDYLWKSVELRILTGNRFQLPVQSVGIMRNATVVLPAQTNLNTLV